MEAPPDISIAQRIDGQWSVAGTRIACRSVVSSIINQSMLNMSPNWVVLAAVIMFMAGTDNIDLQ